MCFHKEILILKTDVAAYLDINNIFFFRLKHTNQLNQCPMTNIIRCNFTIVTISILTKYNFANIWYLRAVVVKHEM